MMILARRSTSLSVLLFFVILWLYKRGLVLISLVEFQRTSNTTGFRNVTLAQTTSVSHKGLHPLIFNPGTIKPLGQPYTKMLVVPRMKEEDVEWILEHFGHNDYINSTVYHAGDSPNSSLHVSTNKGHEVMVYLSYIIENYDKLADVNIFMHAHRLAWHNNELLDHDAVQVIARLSAERVQREGYVNLRCHWEPGCPSWMHPGDLEEDMNKQEQTMLARAWIELFPFRSIPNVLAQPCCAQFAISAERIRALPRTTYEYYREWLLRTPLSDYISGRVWEYIWQYVFTGNNVVCPMEHVCYCDGFGVCFGGEEQYNNYWVRHREMRSFEKELRELEEWQKNKNLQEISEGNDQVVEMESNMELKDKIDSLRLWCVQEKQLAKEHGDLAMSRALEAGRFWKSGDGF